MSQFALHSWTAVAVTVALCATFRSRLYGTFRAVLLSLHTLIATAVLPSLAETLGWVSGSESSLTHGPGLILLYLHVTVFLDAVLLVRPRPRPWWYRATISLPAQYFGASTLLAFPWALGTLLGVTPHGVFLPYLLGLVGLYQSVTLKEEEFLLEVGAVPPKDGVVRLLSTEKRSLLKSSVGQENPAAPQSPRLRIIQITDPHLGPFMSVGRLKKICARAVEKDPDLVLLTGDFLTMESQGSAHPLTLALSPLAQLKGRVYACLGNHDHEALDHVTKALTDNNVILLVDDQVTLETRVGPVQILGFDFHFRERKEKMHQVLEAHPRAISVPRLALLHDPGAFKHLPDGAADLVVSGHTHGGQIGLVSLGSSFTLAHAIAKIPDHGFWASGTNRLYIHRGTGHYGYPLRLGVPGEESVMHVAFVQPAALSAPSS